MMSALHLQKTLVLYPHVHGLASFLMRLDFNAPSRAENQSNTSLTVLAMGAPTACRQTVSGSISLPSPGFFSPFPHGTGSLSVIKEYLALADGPAGFTLGYTCPVLLGIHAHKRLFSLTGLSPSLDGPSSPFN
jgi:hypothetical protein